MFDQWIFNEGKNQTLKKIRKIETFSPILIKSFDNFNNIKSNLLDAFEKTNEAKEEVFDDAYLKISKSDYHVHKMQDRPWVNIIEKDIKNNLSDLCDFLGYEIFSISTMWFQQYKTKSTHGWHLHLNDHYSGVFYLEMPEDGPQTEFYDPATESVYNFAMKEGEIAIFPAHLIHRSAPNNSKSRKTIVSFNISFGLLDNKQHFLNNLSESVNKNG